MDGTCINSLNELERTRVEQTAIQREKHHLSAQEQLNHLLLCYLFFLRAIVLLPYDVLNYTIC